MPGAAAAWDRRLLATALQATVPMTASPIDPPPGVDQAGGHRPAGGAVPGTCTLPSPADADPHSGPGADRVSGHRTTGVICGHGQRRRLEEVTG